MVSVSSQEANLTGYCLGAGGGECLDVQVCGRACWWRCRCLGVYEESNTMIPTTSTSIMITKTMTNHFVM